MNSSLVKNTLQREIHNYYNLIGHPTIAGDSTNNFLNFTLHDAMLLIHTVNLPWHILNRKRIKLKDVAPAVVLYHELLALIQRANC